MQTNIRFSYGLRNILNPLLGYITKQFILALIASGKRGRKGTYYPNDLKRVSLILETVSDVTGRHYEIAVENGNVQAAMAQLGAWLQWEEFAIQDY